MVRVAHRLARDPVEQVVGAVRATPDDCVLVLALIVISSVSAPYQPSVAPLHEAGRVRVARSGWTGKSRNPASQRQHARPRDRDKLNFIRTRVRHSDRTAASSCVVPHQRLRLGQVYLTTPRPRRTLETGWYSEGPPTTAGEAGPRPVAAEATG